MRIKDTDSRAARNHDGPGAAGKACAPCVSQQVYIRSQFTVGFENPLLVLRWQGNPFRNIRSRMPYSKISSGGDQEKPKSGRYGNGNRLHLLAAVRRGHYHAHRSSSLAELNVVVDRITTLDTDVVGLDGPDKIAPAAASTQADCCIGRVQKRRDGAVSADRDAVGPCIINHNGLGRDAGRNPV